MDRKWMHKWMDGHDDRVKDQYMLILGNFIDLIFRDIIKKKTISNSVTNITTKNPK